MDEATNTLPTTRPLTGGAETMRRLVARGMPDLRAGLDGRHPDSQGPMDVAERLWRSSLFLAIVDEPELVHETLALITFCGHGNARCCLEEFIRPYDPLILDAFGPSAIHFCGRGDYDIGAMTASSVPLRSADLDRIGGPGPVPNPGGRWGLGPS